MKIGEAESWLRDSVRSIYDKDEAASISSMVMEHVTSLRRIERISRKEEILHDDQLHRITEVAQRLQTTEPVQYILGEAHFSGMNLYVNKAVLIPRPETEELVEWIVNDVKRKGMPVFERGGSEADVTDKLKILDVGTGSGCIALAIKKRMPLAEVWGCDVSEEALNVARRNGSQLDIRIDFQGVDFLDLTQHKALPTVDMVISNPPYIPHAENSSLHPNILQFEPHKALFVPDNDALIFYKALAHFGHYRLYSGGAVYCEIHEDMGAEVVSLFDSEGYASVELRKDMQGKDRMVKAMKT